MSSSSFCTIFICTLIFKTHSSMRSRCGVDSIILLYSKYFCICFCNGNEIHDNVCGPKRLKATPKNRPLNLSLTPGHSWFIKFSDVSGCICKSKISMILLTLNIQSDKEIKGKIKQLFS